MPKTRFAILKGYAKPVILGIDGAKIFTEGNVYEVETIGGVIIVKDLGESAEDETKNITVNDALMDARHCYTKKEFEKK